MQKPLRGRIFSWMRYAVGSEYGILFSGFFFGSSVIPRPVAWLRGTSTVRAESRALPPPHCPTASLPWDESGCQHRRVNGGPGMSGGHLHRRPRATLLSNCGAERNSAELNSNSNSLRRSYSFYGEIRCKRGTGAAKVGLDCVVARDLYG